MTRVLHIGKYFAPHRGGMETFLGDLMAAQQRAGASVSALVHSSDARLGEEHTRCDVGGQSLSVTRAAAWFTLVFAPIAPTFILSLRRLLSRERPTVLHLHLPNPSVFWLLLLPSARALPWIVHWHSDVVATGSPGLRLLYPLYRPLEQLVLARAARIIATSPPYRDSSPALRDHLPRCVVVPLGLDPTRLTAAAERASDGPGIDAGVAAPARTPEPAGTSALAASRAPATPGAALLAVGRLTYYKGFATLLAALERAPGVTLTLIGSGEQAAALHAQARDLGIDSRVTFCGAASDADLAAALCGCDLLVLPSLERTEAFGLVLLEAMVFERALLAGDVPGSGMPWVVRESGAGEVFTPGDADALAAAILRMLADRDKLRSLGETGRRRFDTHFHIDIATRRIQALYDEVTGAGDIPLPDQPPESPDP